jgi:ribosomal-protein-alanine N-acetyltransferase
MLSYHVPADVTTASPSNDLGPRVRRAGREDLLAVYQIEQSAFPQPWPFSAFEQYLGEPGFLVADDSTIVGYIVADTVTNRGRRVGHVKDLAVHEGNRRVGIGTKLLSRALGVLDQQGVPAVKLEVRETNERARELYRTYGFEHRNTIHAYYSDGEDALVLVRQL